MKTYACKTINCDGVVSFPDRHEGKDLAASPRKSMDISFTIIQNKPVECPKCGSSYYERELENS